MKPAPDVTTLNPAGTALAGVGITELPYSPAEIGVPSSPSVGGASPAGQKSSLEFKEALSDECAYRMAADEAEIARRIIAMELRRAKRLKRLPFQDSPPDDDLDHHQRRIEGCVRRIDQLRAKYANRPRVDLHISLADLGAGLVAAREAAGLTLADLAGHLSVPIGQAERWEMHGYAALPLGELPALLKAIGLCESASLRLRNAVPNLGDAKRPEPIPSTPTPEK